jgi:hypothetical protein
MDLTYTNALIIQHCAVNGRLEQAVRAYHVGSPRLYTQGRLGLHVTFIPTGKRKMAYYSMTEDNLRYLTIGSYPSSVRVNTRGLPGNRHKSKKA